MLSTVCSTFKKIGTGALLCAGLTITSSQIQATPLNFNLKQAPAPDFASFFLDVMYNSSTNLLTVNGFAQTFREGSTNTHDITDSGMMDSGIFSLNAFIDDTGNFLSGDFSITGTISALTYTTDTLLTGNLTAFGFSDSAASTNDTTLEFLFDATGGDTLSLFTGTGGIIVSDTGFAGDWSNDWNNNFGFQGWGLGRADAGVVVSAPATLWLIAAGIGLFGVTRRYRTQA